MAPGAASTIIDAETTPTKLVRSNPDGTRTAKISQAPVRFKDGAGAWTDYDLSVVARPDGSLGAKAAPHAATLAKNAGGAVATVATSAGPVGLRHPGVVAVTAVLDKNQAAYAQALPGGRDLRLTLTPDGFEESVVLPDATGPGSYVDELVLPAAVTARNAQAGVELVDKAGTVVSTFGGGLAYDASSSGVPPTPVSVRVVSQAARVATVAVAIADPTWLGAPGRSFPVTIDPTWSQSSAAGYGGQNAQIIDGSYADTSFPGFQLLEVGVGANRFRSLLGFDLSSVNGATVTAAQVYLYDVASGPTNTCTPRAMSIAGLAGPFSASTTWNTRPALDTNPVLTPPPFAHSTQAGTSCPSDWVALDVTPMAQRWVSGTNYGMQLQTDEVDPNDGQIFEAAQAGPSWAPFIVVTLNERVPNPPTNVVATPNADGSVGVSWSAPTPNGGSAVSNNLIYALNPDLSYAGSYAFATPPATTATLAGLDRSRPYIFGVYPTNDNFAHYSFGASPVVTTVADPMAGAGDQPWFSYDSFGLNDRLGAKVNIGTGNLVVSGADLTLPVVGGARSVGRTYNSLAKDASSALFGYGWRFSEAPDRRLEILSDGSARYDSPSGNATVFANGMPPAPPYTLSTAPGIDATLMHNANGTYTLTFHASGEVLTFRSDGLLTADADRYANTITYTYGAGWETTITGTAGSSPGNTVNINYSGPGGKVSAVTQTADGVTRTVGYTYDGAANLWKVTDANGGVTTFLYDASHRMTSIAGSGSGSMAQVTTIGYDASNRVTTVTRAIPGDTTALTTYNYATPGHTKVTDPDNHPAVDYTVDSLGRVTVITDPKNPATQISYIDPLNPSANTDNKVQWSRNGSGGTTTYVWGANARESLTSATDATGATTTSTYANTGPLAWAANSLSDSLGITTAIAYNGTVPDPRTVQNTSSSDFGATLYNPDGTVSSSTDPNNVSTSLVDVLLQDTTRSTRYAYASHQLQTVTPPAGTSLGVGSFTYDGAGRLKTATSAKGIVTTLSYDNLDRITTQAFTGGTASIVTGYDANGNATSRTDASGLTSWVYDAANRLRTKTLPGGAVLSYAYDPAANLTSATDAGGTTLYHYDQVNELDQVTEPGSGRTDVFAYDADHRLTHSWMATNAGVIYDASGNVVVAPTGFASHIRRIYDTAGNLTNIVTTRASSDADANRLSDLTYTYVAPVGTSCAGAPVGRATDKRQRVTDNLTAKTTDDCDDSAGRLTSAVTSGGPTYTYGYDKDSNRITDAAGTHTFNAANQLTDAGVTYDADGNLTATTAFPTLTYNGIGQTTAITPAGQAQVPFTYAGAGQAERTSAGTTTARNGALGVQSETTAGLTTSYVSGPGGKLMTHTPGGDFYFYVDGLGSVIGLVDPTGNQRAAYTYDPYGANATATAVNGTLPANPWRFAGGYFDAATGLYHFGARYYDPVMGRFTQIDPVAGGSCNGYDYVCGDPVNGSDLGGTSGKQPALPAEFEGRCNPLLNSDYGELTSGLCTAYRYAQMTGNTLQDFYYQGYNSLQNPVNLAQRRSIPCPAAVRIASEVAGAGGFGRALKSAWHGHFNTALDQATGTAITAYIPLPRQVTAVATAVDYLCSVAA